MFGYARRADLRMRADIEEPCHMARAAGLPFAAGPAQTLDELSDKSRFAQGEVGQGFKYPSGVRIRLHALDNSCKHFDAAPDNRGLVQKEVADRFLDDRGNALKAVCAYAIGTVLVLLDLLKCYANAFRECTL